MYKQTLTKYKTIMMGNGTESIYNVGCYFISLVNALELKGHKYTPEQLNDLFKSLNLWGRATKNYINVDTIAKAMPKIFKSYFKEEPFKDSNLLDYMKRKLSVIAKVNAAAIGGTGTHFVLVTAYDGIVATIYDPWYGEEVPVTKRYGKYGNLLGLRVFEIIPAVDNSPKDWKDYFLFDVSKKLDDVIFKGLGLDKANGLKRETALDSFKDEWNTLQDKNNDLEIECQELEAKIYKLEEEIKTKKTNDNIQVVTVQPIDEPETEILDDEIQSNPKTDVKVNDSVEIVSLIKKLISFFKGSNGK